MASWTPAIDEECIHYTGLESAPFRRVKFKASIEKGMYFRCWVLETNSSQPLYTGAIFPVSMEKELNEWHDDVMSTKALLAKVEGRIYQLINSRGKQA